MLPLAELLYIMLNSCAGHEDLDAYIKFKREHRHLHEVEQMRDALIYHINQIDPWRSATYSFTWRFEHFPECWETHVWLREFNGERCMECIYYYLSLDISRLS